MLTLSVLLEMLKLSNSNGTDVPYRWHFSSADGRPVLCSNGSLQQVVTPWGQGASSQILLVLGDEQEPQFARSLAAHIRKSWRFGRVVIGTDRGVFAVAQAGILNGHRFALQRSLLDEFTANFGDFAPSGAAFEIDSNIITCAGGLVTADLVLALVEDHHGRLTRAYVEDSAMWLRMRKPGDPAVAHPLKSITQKAPELANAIRFIEDRLDETDLIATVTTELGISRRQLERLFSSHIHTTPLKYITGKRLEKALRLMAVSQISLLDVALECGFGSRTTFAKAFKRKHGVAPENFF